MKKFLFLGIGTALMFTMGGVGPASADGGPHVSSAADAGATNFAVGALNTTGRCASCHRAHTAKAEYLLKQAQPQLCYSCHDGSVASTNVIDGNAGNPLTGLRGGGFASAKIGSGAATKDMGALDPVSGRIATLNQTIPVGAAEATTSKHQIDGQTAGTAWGSYTDVAVAATATIAGNNNGLGKSITLECGSCHDPHGNKNYRALRPIPNDANNIVVPAVKAINIGDKLPSGAIATAADVVVAVPAVMSITKGINIPDATASVYTTVNYWLSGDSYVRQNTAAEITAGNSALTGTAKATDVAGDGYIQNISAWCTTCHTRYLAVSGSYAKARVGTSTVVTANQPTLTNVDANYTYQHRTDSNYKGSAPNCITCHVSHGSNATVTAPQAGDFNPGGTSSVNAAGANDSRLLRVDNRGTCSMCHNV